VPRGQLALRPHSSNAVSLVLRQRSEQKRWVGRLDKLIPPHRSATAQQAWISAEFAPADPQHVAQQWRYIASARATKVSQACGGVAAGGGIRGYRLDLARASHAQAARMRKGVT